ELVGQQELAERAGEARTELSTEDRPGPDIVAITETAGNAEDLKLAEQFGTFEDAEEVHPFGAGAAMLESVRRLDVAVGSRGAEDDDSGGHGRWFVGGEAALFVILIKVPGGRKNASWRGGVEEWES